MKTTTLEVSEFRRNLVYCAITALLESMTAPLAGASENGAAHYPTGTNTVAPALMPPPGESLWLNYLTYYTADRSNNSNGDSAVPGYHVSAVAEAARFLHTWLSIDGMAWTSGIVIVANDAHLQVPHRSGSGGGLDDLVIQPVLLTAAFGNLHVLGDLMSLCRVEITARTISSILVLTIRRPPRR